MRYVMLDNLINGVAAIYGTRAVLSWAQGSPLSADSETSFTVPANIAKYISVIHSQGIVCITEEFIVYHCVCITEEFIVLNQSMVANDTQKAEWFEHKNHRVA